MSFQVYETKLVKTKLINEINISYFKQWATKVLFTYQWQLPRIFHRDTYL